MALALLRALVDRGHHVDVVLSQTHKGIPAEYVIDGMRVHPYRDKQDPFRFLGDTDVIVTYLENTQRASTLGQMYGIPVVHLCHNTFPPTKKWLLRGGPALAVYNSQWMADHFADVDVRSIIVHPPVPTADYATTPGDAITLINLFESKGSKVFYALAERFPDQQFLGVRGGYGEQVINGLPNVEILDHVDGDRMRDQVYARTRVLLMPSIYESWGRTGVEAMCSGIPVIAHPTPGLRESLGDAGIFADRDDVDAWERELRRLLDGRRWRSASRRAKARAAELDPAGDLVRWCEAVESLLRPAVSRRALARI